MNYNDNNITDIGGGTMGLLDSLFGKKSVEKYLEKIEKLEEKLTLKEQEIERLVFENDGLKSQLQQMDSTKIVPKQLEIFEKNVKESREEITKLANVLKNFGIPLKKQYHSYKVEIAKIFSSSRFAEVLAALQEKGYTYVSQIPLHEIKEEFLTLKNGEEALQRCQAFLEGKYDWEIATMRNKGEKVFKVFGRGKKLSQFFTDSYLEYMDDLDRVDLNILETYGFTKEQIQEMEEKRDAYYAEHRVK